MPAPTPGPDRHRVRVSSTVHESSTTLLGGLSRPGLCTVTQRFSVPPDESVERNMLSPSRLHWNRGVRVAGQGWNTSGLPLVWVAPPSRHIPSGAPDDSELISLRYRSAV